MKYVVYVFLILFSNIKLFILKIVGKKINFKNFIVLYPFVSFKTINKGKILINNKVFLKNNVEINCDGGLIELKGNNYINRNTIIVSHHKIIIGENTTIGPNCCIYDHDHDGKGGFISKPIEIGKNVWIGAGCIILKDVKIGDNSIIGAGTLVNKNVPPNSIMINKRNVFITERKDN